MQTTEVVFAGFGGQGVMLMGQMLAYAGMNEGRQVCYMPSYGPEMRGGTANCSIAISDRPIGSPVVRNPRHIAVLNLPSLEKFEHRVRAGGLLLINSSLIEPTSARTDIEVLRIPANDLAQAEGNPRAANMAMLGAYIGRTGTVKLESIEEMVRKQFSRKPELLEPNLRVLHRGFALGTAATVAAEAAAAANAGETATGVAQGVAPAQDAEVGR